MDEIYHRTMMRTSFSDDNFQPYFGNFELFDDFFTRECETKPNIADIWLNHSYTVKNRER